MLTVTKLTPAHDILAGNDIAEDALNCGIREVMVVIDRGQIIAVRTPPCCQDQFASDDDWIFSDMRAMYSRGINAALEGKLAMHSAPAGWTHWSDLKPGDVASSGDGRVLLLGNPGAFDNTIPRTYANAAWVGENTWLSVFTLKPDAPPPLPFVRIEARGLTDAQLRHVAAAVDVGEHGIAYIIEHLPSDASLAAAAEHRRRKNSGEG